MKFKKARLHFTHSKSPFAGLGNLIYRCRVWVLIVWGIVTLLSLISTPLLESSLQEVKVVDQTGEANRTEQLLQQEFNIDPNALTLVFQLPEGAVPNNAQSEIQAIVASVRELPGIKHITNPSDRPDYRSADGRVQYSVIELSSQKKLSSDIETIEQVLAERSSQDSSQGFSQSSSQSSSQRITTYLTGKPAIDREVQRISKADLGRVELWVLPIMLGVLILVFGSLVAATMPIAIGIVAVSTTLGLLYVVSLKLSVSVFALNLTSMLGLGLGIDYALLIVKRFQQELRDRPIEQAISVTLATAGRAIFFSGLTVCVSLFGLMLFPIRLLQSLGIAGAIVVLLSVLSALTLLPALLSVVGHRIYYGSIFSVTDGPQRFWSRIARIVIRYSLPAAVAVLVIVAGLTAPFFAAEFGIANAEVLPQSNPAREGVDVLNRAFGAGETSPILLAIQPEQPGDDLFSAQHIETLYRFIRRVQSDPRVSSVQSLVNIDPRLGLADYQQLYSNPTLLAASPIAAAVNQFSHGSTTLAIVKSRTGIHNKASRELVQELRANGQASKPENSLPNLKIQVTGQTASELDTIDAITQRLPTVLAVIMVATFIVLAFLLNSIALPIKAMIANLLSMGASFGALVFIFQWGHFQRLLNFTPVGYIDILLPIVLFCVLFGLSMDYEVFLLTRIKETYDLLKLSGKASSKSNTESVVVGLEETGQLITSAALLVIIVTSAFAFTSLIIIKALGLGIAIAIAVDASLIRLILVPAAMKLMGKWNWWTPW